MFNDGVINMGRVLVLFGFTCQMRQQYPTDAWKFWDIYHAVLKGTEYEYFNRSLIHQNRGKGTNQKVPLHKQLTNRNTERLSNQIRRYE